MTSDQIIFREITKNDLPFLSEMLYQAIYVEDGQPLPSKNILSDKNISKYVSNWGRIGDFGIIAVSANQCVGAIWIRLFEASSPGFGFVNPETPELSMAVDYKFRSKGIGDKLLKYILIEISKKYHSVSLSVSLKNKAIHLYKKNGFIEVGTFGDSITLKKCFK